jgi:hypothetical protein
MTWAATGKVDNQTQDRLEIKLGTDILGCLVGLLMVLAAILEFGYLFFGSPWLGVVLPALSFGPGVALRSVTIKAFAGTSGRRVIVPVKNAFPIRPMTLHPLKSSFLSVVDKKKRFL